MQPSEMFTIVLKEEQSCDDESDFLKQVEDYSREVLNDLLLWTLASTIGIEMMEIFGK